MTSNPRAIALLAGALMLSLAWPAAAQSRAGAQAGYQRLLSKERTLVTSTRPPAPKQVRSLIAAYEHFAGRYARSGYADNALWQAAQLASSLATRTQATSDRTTARRILQFLVKAYPSSSLLPTARLALRDLTRAPAPARAAPPSAPSPAPPLRNVAVPPVLASSPLLASMLPVTTDIPVPPASLATLGDIRRAVMNDVVRVTLELSREISYQDQRLDSPSRLALDLGTTQPSAALGRSTRTYADDIVREVAFAPTAGQSTRVLLDLEGAERYSMFTLYNPYRLVVDIYRKPASAHVAPARSGVTTTAVGEPAGPLALNARQLPVARGLARLASPPDSRAARDLDADTPPVLMPVAPAANTSGSFSISRQLGLGVSRIVIDPGHGGHDPGALGPRVSEAELVLDVALRLEKLLRKNPGLDVSLTRRTNTFVPLEERTAIANKFGADLFLSIHANASRNTSARGIETYFLNFASSADAAAVAARENAASARSMHHLTDIVKAIALNNKVDESRDLAHAVQASLIKGAKHDDRQVRDLGVKQAPFVVLVGASMPSVLAEISFITNPTDAQKLRTAAYRQRIAESLAEALLKYQRSLKATETASRE